jgi:hypothetical protein
MIRARVGARARVIADVVKLLLKSTRAGFDLRFHVMKLIRTFRFYTDHARLIAQEEDGGRGLNQGSGSIIEVEEYKPRLRILHLIMNGGAAIKLLKPQP